MYSHQSCCFSAQPAHSKCHTLKTLCLSQFHLVNREIAFRTDQHQHILSSSDGIFKHHLLSQTFFLMTMTNELLHPCSICFFPFLHLKQKSLEVHHLVQHRHPSLVALFHGRHKNLLHSL